MKFRNGIYSSGDYNLQSAGLIKGKAVMIKVFNHKQPLPHSPISLAFTLYLSVSPMFYALTGLGAGLVLTTSEAKAADGQVMTPSNPGVPTYPAQFPNRYRPGNFPNRPGFPPNGRAQFANSRPAPAAQPAAKANDEQVLQKSKDIVSANTQWQTFSDYISIKPGQDQIPLQLTFINGVNTPARFQDLRIRLAGRPLATIKDFKGQPSLSLNLTGAVGVGDSLMNIQAFGPVGARLSWKLTTFKIVVTNVTPAAFALTDKVTVQGRNFSERPNVTQVFIGQKSIPIVSVKSDQIQLKPPNDLLGGKADLVVTVGSLRSNPFKVTVKAPPTVESVDFVSTAPSQPITISGKGFSPNASENQVFIGGVPATITSATATSISCAVPENIDCPAWYVPITVKTNGLDSKGEVTINIQQRVIPNEGTPEN